MPRLNQKRLNDKLFRSLKTQLWLYPNHFPNHKKQYFSILLTVKTFTNLITLATILSKVTSPGLIVSPFFITSTILSKIEFLSIYSFFFLSNKERPIKTKYYVWKLNYNFLSNPITESAESASTTRYSHASTTFSLYVILQYPKVFCLSLRNGPNMAKGNHSSLF